MTYDATGLGNLVTFGTLCLQWTNMHWSEEIFWAQVQLLRSRLFSPFLAEEVHDIWVTDLETSVLI